MSAAAPCLSFTVRIPGAARCAPGTPSRRVYGLPCCGRGALGLLWLAVNTVSLAALSSIERSRLKDSLRAIREWQDLAAYHYRTETF